MKKEFEFTNQAYLLYHPLTHSNRTAIDQLVKKRMADELAENPGSAWAKQVKGGAYLEQVCRKVEAVYQDRR
ncbi:hypothetical protein [Hymenobacter daeguensis]